MLSTATILGSGGWLPAYGRHTACALLVNGNRAVLIDAGTGAARLIEQPALLDGIEQLDIVLTHFHLDHIVGLAYLPALGLGERTTIWGPGRALYGAGTEEILARLSHEPFHPISLAEQATVVRELPLGEFELAGTPVETRRQQRHSAPTLGLRFGDLLTWITDTAWDPDSAAFAEGSTVLAHEAWDTTTSPRNPDIHSTAAQAATVAAEARAERLLLIHLPPFLASVADLEAEAAAVFGGAVCATDGGQVFAGG